MTYTGSERRASAVILEKDKAGEGISRAIVSNSVECTVG